MWPCCPSVPGFLALRPKIFWHHPVVAQERGKWLWGLEMTGFCNQVIQGFLIRMLRKVVKFVFQQKPQMVDEHDRPLHIISDGNRHSTRLFPLDVCVCVLDQDVCWDHVNVLVIQNPKK